MSRLSKAVAEQTAKETLRLDEAVENFDGGVSYLYDPLTTLKMITASSIFGEPSYYRDGGLNKGKPSKSYVYRISSFFGVDSIIPKDYEGKTTTDIMISAIDEALTYDYVGTLDWAVELRNTYNIRLNPQIIMVRAAIHPKRKEYTNKICFNDYQKKVMSRADEPMVQMAYYLYQNEGKTKMPSILKRTWANKLSTLDAYNVNKYKNAEIGMINGVRLCHAHSAVIDELMRTGDVEVESSQLTWNQLKSEGKDWKYILDHIRMPHMALLRNLRGIFTEIDDVQILDKVVEQLKAGVKRGKQFPFRYWSAYKVIQYDKKVHHKDVLLDALEDCVDISIENLPRLKGKTMCLTDNSGSAWGGFTSEYGTVTVAEIDNLSAIISAKCSDEGYVGVFGDRLNIVPVSKHDKILRKLKEVSKIGRNIGGSTEGGIWIFFRDAMKNGDKYDNIFIYSDQQAGLGGLYGTSAHMREYRKLGYDCGASYHSHVNVYKILLDYRRKVNNDVNVFSIQSAGYNNNVLPQMARRCFALSGWTGKETLFADMQIKLWDEADGKG